MHTLNGGYGSFVYYICVGKFWKVPTRKFYAVKRPDHERKDRRKLKRKATHYESSSDTDDFLASVNVAKKRMNDVPSNELHILKEDITAICEDIQYLYTIDKRMKIPTSLYRKLSEAFKCHICQHSPITPPVIFARCCKTIIGCQSLC